VAGGDFVLVGGEGGQDFVLFLLRHLEEVQGPSEFGCDLVESPGEILRKDGSGQAAIP